MGRVVHAVPATGPLDEVLAGNLGVEAVRRVALHPLEFGVEPLLDECLPGTGSWSFRLLRSKYKPRRKLTAYYLVTTGGPAPDERHLAVTWRSTEEVPAPGSPGHVSCGPVAVLAYPADPCMPALARLSNGAYLASLALSLCGSDGTDGTDGSDGWASAPLRVGVLRYRPGKRHVLHAVGDADGRGLVVKTDKQDAGSRAVRVARVHGPELERRCPWVGLAQPLGHSAGDRASVWRESAGEPLWRVCTDGGSATALMEGLGEALRVLHDTGPRSTDVGPDAAALPRCRDTDEHAARVLRAGEHIAALLPRVGRAYHDLASRLVERLGRLPGGPPALVHGDLKCDHVLVDGDRFRLIDLDRAGYGDPALDLGALLADLRWWYPDDRAAKLSTALRAGYGPCEVARWARAHTLAALFQLRFAAHRCAVHDPAWGFKVSAQVATATLTARRAGRWC